MNVPIGSQREENLLVTGDVAIRFLDLDAARVLSTPHLIGSLEMTCRNLIRQFLPPGQDSVGTQVNSGTSRPLPSACTSDFVPRWLPSMTAGLIAAWKPGTSARKSGKGRTNVSS